MRTAEGMTTYSSCLSFIMSLSAWQCVQMAGADSSMANAS